LEEVKFKDWGNVTIEEISIPSTGKKVSSNLEKVG
tara:strand:+ start:1021 stop:1125 length:105 start_codon:yes stop_codon:yes gene_type:complete